MWTDEKEELLQQIREDLISLTAYAVVWVVLFAICFKIIL